MEESHPTEEILPTRGVYTPGYFLLPALATPPSHHLANQEEARRDEGRILSLHLLITSEPTDRNEKKTMKKVTTGLAQQET